jgi:nucleotide-binding universal stress UspA family protein
MFRSALVAIKPSAVQSSLIQFAVRVGGEHQLSLSSLTVIDPHQISPSEMVPIGGGAYKSALDEHKLSVARQQASEAQASFAAACQANGVANQTGVHEGNAAEVIASAVQRHDLLLVGHVPGGDMSDTSLFYNILRQNPRPVVVVPQTVTAGQTTVVAYDGSLQAARALAAFAWSGLARQHQVHVLAMHADAQRANELAERAVAFLQSHGMMASSRGMAFSRDIGKTLLEESLRLSASLLVMGAFGQPVVREFFFGSVTKTILQTLPMPLFMEH